jgi:hypothetical protein
MDIPAIEFGDAISRGGSAMLANVSTKPRQGIRWYFATGEADRGGIFDNLGNRLASWPTGYQPTSTNLNIAFKIIAAMPRYGIEVSDKALRQAFDEVRQ